MTSPRLKRFVAVTGAALFALAAGPTRELLAANCGPFTDVSDASPFCSLILEIYTLAITTGTSPTTYSPSANVTREQMAAFQARVYDRTALRTSRRAALGQFWPTSPHYDQGLGLTSVGNSPGFPKSDGVDVWVPVSIGTVARVRASDGKVIDTWTNAGSAYAALVAMGRVFVTKNSNPGALYMIDPAATSGDVTVLPSTLGIGPAGIAFDGTNIWTANISGSVSIVTPGTWNATTVSTGFVTPRGLVFDGTSMWVTDDTANTIIKLNPNGTVAQVVPVAAAPYHPAFDGNNIWVPNAAANALTVVRASDGAVIKIFSAGNGNQNGLSTPVQAAYDGQRILVTNVNGGVSLFKAADLSVIGFVPTLGVSDLNGVCSDGVNFWISFTSNGTIGRF